MQKSAIVESLSQLFYEYFNKTISKISLIPESGSNRQYYRIESDHLTAIGTYSSDFKENKAFFYFSEFFYAKGLAVPKIYVKKINQNIYLQEDLGDIDLFNYLTHNIKNSAVHLKNIYKQIIDALILFQICGIKDIDYSVSYPRNHFDDQSMSWDLNYFKNCFLKLAGFPFDEQLLENDFIKLINFLSVAPDKYFLYRDFQSRNIMLHNNKIYFIDYQGGRRGALQYDLASLLYDDKANLPQDLRDELLEYYIKQLQKQIPYEENLFLSYFYEFALIRLMQAMGAYGFRGLFQRKSIFLKSLPYAKKNLNYLITKSKLIEQLPELHKVFLSICKSKKFNKYSSNG